MNGHRSRLLIYYLMGIVFTAVLLDQSGLVSVVQFTRERIEITVRPGSFAVNGFYLYENPLPWPWSRGLKVPYHRDAGQAAPATIGAFELVGPDREQPIPMVWFGDEPYFTITVPGRGAVGVRVRFEQFCSRPRGTYLLTTTQP